MRRDKAYWHRTYWDISAELERTVAKRDVNKRDVNRTRELLDALKLCARIRDSIGTR